MLFKKEKLQLIKYWCNLNDGYPLWGADDNGDGTFNVFSWELIEEEFNYWTEEETWTHNQITRGSNDR